MTPNHRDADARQGVEFGGEAPTLEVVVYRHGAEIHREACESEEAATDIVDRWSEIDGVTCTVDDLSIQHRAGQILEPEPEEPVEENYPRATGADSRD
jgi:hypothetical protein